MGSTTIAQTFRDAGYQAYAVGKLHIHPQRSRIGFRRCVYSVRKADYSTAWWMTMSFSSVTEATQVNSSAHGMCNNDYLNRPWHLPEDCHVTNWSTAADGADD